MLALRLALCLMLCGAVAWAEDAPTPTLTAEQKLKAENFQLRVKVAELTATVHDREQRLASVELSAEQQALVAEFRMTLQPKDTEVFDWRTLTFTAPPKDGQK